MSPDIKVLQLQEVMQIACKALEGGQDADIVKALAILRQAIEGAMINLPVTPVSFQPLHEAAKCLQEVINAPSPAPDLAANLQPCPELKDLYADLLNLRQFLLALANGDLSQVLRIKGYLAGALKSLQSNLRHLTWQTQRIASGDFSHRVDFLGEFSQAFNAMVVQLDESLQAIKAKDADLTRINMELREEVELRKQTEESLRQNEEMYRQLSITDPLTGIFNRRHFYQLGMLELQRTCRYGHSLAVIMLDVDHFKQVNDLHGHAIGDQVLQALATSVHQSLRVVDTLARYGGEEFIILLPEADLQAAGLTAEKLRSKIADQPLRLDQSQMQITISLGASAFEPAVQPVSPTPATLDHLIKLADQALYEAKRAGRNQVVVSDAGLASCASDRGQ
jgi:diguanylate cyclase (GGDEF)-like protein